jgi:hypothetical protein
MRHRGQQLPYDPERKVRTPGHVIADLSYNFLERKVWSVAIGWTRHATTTVTNKLTASRDGRWVSQRVEARDLRYW